MTTSVGPFLCLLATSSETVGATVTTQGGTDQYLARSSSWGPVLCQWFCHSDAGGVLGVHLLAEPAIAVAGGGCMLVRSVGIACCPSELRMPASPRAGSSVHDILSAIKSVVVCASAPAHQVQGARQHCFV